MNPVISTYQVIKDRAARKKQEWALSLEEFKAFCARTNYMELKGSAADAMTIDRIRSHEGYNANNIQLLPKGVNSAKQNLDYHSPRYIEYLRRTGQYPDQRPEALEQPVEEEEDDGSIFG